MIGHSEDAETTNHVNNNGQLMSQNRFSWNPEWMRSLTWMDTFTIPMQEYLDAEGSEPEDSEDGDADTSSDDSEDGWDVAREDDWVPFFANVCKSIAHSTPWSSKQFTVDVRREVLTNVTARFLERCGDQRKVGKKMKMVLANVMKEDKVANIQSMYVSFTDGQAWKGYDSFRDINNFYRDEDIDAFREQCTQRVQYRLHMINTDWSRKEARVGRAIDIWNEVHQSDTCFGGPLTVILNDIAVHDFSKHIKLPKRVTATISLRAGHELHGESFIRRAAVLSDDGTTLAWDPPQPVGLHLGLGGLSAEDATLVINLISMEMCGVCQPSNVGTVTIPLIALYENVLPLDSPKRDDYDFGVHHCSGFFTDSVTGLGCHCTFALRCLDEMHHKKLPKIDVIKEQDRRRRVLESVNNDIWLLDHHAAFTRLVDLLGDLTDADCLALKLYCDRFLIHDELYEVAIRVAAITHGQFNDPDTRELTTISAQQLKEMRPNILTKSNARWIDDALVKARKVSIERLIAIEDVTDDPLDAADVFENCRLILDVCGVPKAELTKIVTTKSQEIGDQLARKVKKLINYMRLKPEAASSVANTNGGLFSPSSKERGTSEQNPMEETESGELRPQSALFELEQREDKGILVGKSKVLYDLVDRGLTTASVALKFAVDSRSDAVLGIALVRTEVLVSALTPHVHTAVIAFISELAQSVEPDPLGDTFGILTMLYSRVMECVDQFADHPALEKLIDPLVKIFDGYLPGWFSLCRDKVYSWIRSIVKEEPLQAIVPGKVHCNQAPSDTINLLNSLAEVFKRCLQYSDTEMLPSHVTSFSKLISSVCEEFLDGLIAKGHAATDTPAMCVCMSSFTKFNQLVGKFWEEEVFEEIIHEIDDKDRLLESQGKLIKAETMALIQERTDEYAATIRGKMRQWTNSTFELQGKVAEDVIDSEFCDFVFEKTVSELMLICDSLDETVANTLVLPEVVTALHMAFVDYVATCAVVPLKGGRVRTCQQVLESIDGAIDQVCTGRVAQDTLFDLSRRSRVKIQLAELETSELIESITSKGEGLSQREREQFISILSNRSDSMAVKFLKDWSAAGNSLAGSKKQQQQHANAGQYFL